MSALEPSANPDTELLVRLVIEIVNNAKSVPLSASVMITKDEILELLEDALDQLPEELRQARWMLKEREEFLAKTQRDADDILEAARVRAERMVERQEIVREARHTAQRVLEDARDEARRLRHEAEDFCDQKLAGFEIVLERTLKMVQSGREKLRVTPLPPAEAGEIGFGGNAGDVAGSAADEPFFDQDRLQ